MKKKTFMGIMALIAAMLLSVSGTCFAQETVFVDQTLSGTTRLWTGLAYSFSTPAADGNRGVNTSGQTAYGIISGLTEVGAGLHPAGNPSQKALGATPFAVWDSDANADDILDRIVFAAAPAGMPQYWSSSTAYVQPAVISGETNAFVVLIQSGATHAVANSFAAGANNGMSGATLAMIDGATMTINWAFGIPENAQRSGASYYISNAFAGETAYFPTQLTVWTPGTVLDTTGATIYGTSGVSSVGAESAASVWAVTNWGALITNGTTAWPANQAYAGVGSNGRLNVFDTGRVTAVSVSAISGFVAAPVISGESVFYVGYNGNIGGITVYQLDKDDLGPVGGVINASTVKPVSIRPDRFMPTPVASGGSLFVVCNQGGVTVYDTQDLTTSFGVGGRTVGQLGANGAGTGGSFLLPAGAVGTGVTASPVVYEYDNEGDPLPDPYIVFCGTSAVTCYQISNGLGTNTRAWWYNFAANISPASQIWGTPAVSNGFVYVPVVWGANGTIFVFDIDAGNNAWVARHDLNGPIYADPIVVNTDIWSVSLGNAPQSASVYKFQEAGTGRALANPYWTQFKFDAAKTGHNTLVDDDDFFPSDGGCFISTVK
jgi:hypothetical protein